MCRWARVREDNRETNEAAKVTRSRSLFFSKVRESGLNGRFRNSIVYVCQIKITLAERRDKSSHFTSTPSFFVRFLSRGSIFRTGEDLREEKRKSVAKEGSIETPWRTRVVDVEYVVTCVKNEPRSSDLSAVLLLQST